MTSPSSFSPHASAPTPPNPTSSATTSNTAASERAERLRNTTYAFCHALLTPASPPPGLLSRFFSEEPRIFEHRPAWANMSLPFLGKPFIGKGACLEYFRLLGEVLDMRLSADAFPGAEGFVVDAQSESAGSLAKGSASKSKGARGMVSVVGQGSFSSKKTGKGWDEEFIYRFSEFDGEWRIGCWEIWADPLSAWDAVCGT